MSRKKKYESIAGYGVDVSYHRVDDLDRMVLERISECAEAVVLDVGCGLGGQSLRMVQRGARVTAVDVYDFSKIFSQYREDNDWSTNQLSFHELDMRTLGRVFAGKKFSIAVLQRVLHYLPYSAARQCLSDLRQLVTDALYLSVTGVDTAIGSHYPHKALPLTDRFTQLSSVGKELFSIHEPLCLYQKGELEALLIETGWRIERSWVSQFGNSKVVCR